MSSNQYSLTAINQRLKSAKVKVSLKVRGDRITLQATLPSQNPLKPKPYQQEIYMGIPASLDGFKQAEKEARKLGALIALNQFDWNLYKPEKPPDEIQTVEPPPIVENIGDVLTRFKKWYMETHTLNDQSWLTDWHKEFSRLPKDVPLTADVLLKRVDATTRNTRHRKATCRCLQALANFAGVDVDLKQFQGNYSSARPKDRVIPTDKEIVEARSLIYNPAWRWVYGMMAAYGLRPHEVWFCEFIPNTHELLVRRGKTGARTVFTALYPEWVDQWNLTDINLPGINGETHYHKLGDKTCKSMRYYRVPFSSYNLRHAYAIRASVVFGMPITTSASLMGHTPRQHLQTYQRHISVSQNKIVAERILNNPDRPIPPVFE